MSVNITSLSVENVKRVKAVQLQPSPTGLTVIGGRNGQGKTSVLDAIAWALGGEKFHPTNATRDGSVIPPKIRVTLSNGLQVERSGKNGALKVIDPNGNAQGQTLLNEFISAFALNLPAFMALSAKDKAAKLLTIIGIGDELFRLDAEEKSAYNERLTLGRIADQKTKAAAELPHYDGVPEDIISGAELVRQQQDILRRNAENAQLRANREEIHRQLEMREAQLADLQATVEKLRSQAATADMATLGLEDESTAELEEALERLEDTNRKIRANLDREKAQNDADQLQAQYKALTDRIESVRRAKMDLLNGAELPLPGLTVEDGVLNYKGHAWDCMSSSEQLRVATAIVRQLNPECGFVLLDKLEQMDPQTMQEFGAWLETEGLQAIATRVSTGGECSIIIEDGMSAEPAAEPTQKNAPAAEPQRTWKPGQF